MTNFPVTKDTVDRLLAGGLINYGGVWVTPQRKRWLDQCLTTSSAEPGRSA